MLKAKYFFKSNCFWKQKCKKTNKKKTWKMFFYIYFNIFLLHSICQSIYVYQIYLCGLI